MKRILTLLAFVALTITANAVIQSGSCGTNVTFVLNDDGTLVISGSGEMENYDNPYTTSSVVPWNKYRDYIIKVQMEDGVTSIGSYAFYECSGLTSVTIPNSVTSIGERAFVKCSGLTSVTIGNSVTSIGEAVFQACSGLTSITVENENPHYDSRNNCNAIIETNTNTLISGCKNTTIPNSVMSIGEVAFAGCSGLTSITIPNSVTSIGDVAFAGCSGLTSITIPNSVTSIGVRAFFKCSGLTSVTIGNSVTSIGGAAFYRCSKIKEIHSQAITPPTASASTFNGINTNDCKLYVPIGTREDYAFAEGWKTFINIIEETVISDEEADRQAIDEANKFKTDNASILGKTTSTVTSSDLDAINKALEDYDKLSDAAKDKLTNGEKALLDSLKKKAEELKAEEEADKKATDEANKFKTDNATILGKTTSTVKSSDLDAINKALEDYNNLSEAAKNKLTNGEKALLDSLKTKAEELKAAEEADKKATDEANKFKTDNATILGKTTSTVKSSDLDAINKALEDYNKLSDAAKEKLTIAKILLDSLKLKAEEFKAAEEADKKATDEANKFKTDNATILGKTTSSVKSSDLDAINKALDDYSKLSDAAKDKLTNGEKALLDSLKKKVEELKAAEEADAAATAEANKFKTDNADILAKTTATVTDADLAAINKALEDYDKLSDAAKAKLTNEKALLDALKATASADKDTKDAVAKFREDNSAILAKSVDEVTESDLAATNKALEDYGKLTDAAKAALSVEKKLLDDMKAKIEKDKAIVAEVEKFKTDNAAILGKSTEDITSADLDAINKALDDYDKLSDEAKNQLTNGEKDLLDSLKDKAEELKAAEEAEKKATEDAEGFKTDNKDILDKDLSEITPEDLDAINKALDDYEKLSDEAKDKLKDEKKDLENKKDKAEEIASGIERMHNSEPEVGDQGESQCRMQTIYNLNGQRVNNNVKGLVIKNGKKVMVK